MHNANPISNPKILIAASPNAPPEAACPACGGKVSLRRRKQRDGAITWYYRHKNGQGQNCPRRYHP